MTYYLRFFLLFFCAYIINSGLLIASVNDTLPKDTLKEAPVNIILNLDSLSKLWYVRSSLSQNINKQIPQDKKVISSKISEKEFNKKISSLKLTIKFSYNEKIKQYIEKFIFEKNSQTEILIGLMNYYSPFIEKDIKANGLPDELKFLPIAESSLFNNAKSESGATGIWQLSFANAKHYGIEVNSYIDERKDVKKATMAALKDVKDLNKIYNDWFLSIAAFNSSPAIVNKAIRRAKGKMDYWTVYKYLPHDCRDYVPAFIAAVYVMNFYKDYHLQPLVINMPDKADTVKIYKQLYLKQVSAVIDIPFKQLCELNPVYKRAIVPERATGFDLALPVGYGGRFFLHKDSIYKYVDSSFKKIMKQPLNFKNEQSQEDVKSTTEIYYIVKSNDYLGKIAKNYNVTVSELVKWNKLKAKTLKKGQKLRIIFKTSEDKKQTIAPEKLSPLEKTRLANIYKDVDSKKQKYDSIILKADDLYSLKKLKQARDLYKNASSLYPALDYPKIRITQINEILRKEEYDKALEEIKKIKMDTAVTKPTINKAATKSDIKLNPNPNQKKDSVNDLRPTTKDLRLIIDTTNVEKTSEFIIYKVKQGDYLGRIAKAFGVKVKDLLLLNSFDDTHKLKPGEKIKIRKLVVSK